MLLLNISKEKVEFCFKPGWSPVSWIVGRGWRKSSFLFLTPVNRVQPRGRREGFLAD